MAHPIQNQHAATVAQPTASTATCVLSSNPANAADVNSNPSAVGSGSGSSAVNHARPDGPVPPIHGPVPPGTQCNEVGSRKNSREPSGEHPMIEEIIRSSAQRMSAFMFSVLEGGSIDEFDPSALENFFALLTEEYERQYGQLRCAHNMAQADRRGRPSTSTRLQSPADGRDALIDGTSGSAVHAGDSNIDSRIRPPSPSALREADHSRPTAFGEVFTEQLRGEWCMEQISSGNVDEGVLTVAERLGDSADPVVCYVKFPTHCDMKYSPQQLKRSHKDPGVKIGALSAPSPRTNFAATGGDSVSCGTPCKLPNVFVAGKKSGASGSPARGLPRSRRGVLCGESVRYFEHIDLVAGGGGENIEGTSSESSTRAIAGADTTSTPVVTKSAEEVMESMDAMDDLREFVEVLRPGSTAKSKGKAPDTPYIFRTPLRCDSEAHTSADRSLLVRHHGYWVTLTELRFIMQHDLEPMKCRTRTEKSEGQTDVLSEVYLMWTPPGQSRCDPSHYAEPPRSPAKKSVSCTALPLKKRGASSALASLGYDSEFKVFRDKRLKRVRRVIVPVDDDDNEDGGVQVVDAREQSTPTRPTPSNESSRRATGSSLSTSSTALVKSVLKQVIDQQYHVYIPSHMTRKLLLVHIAIVKLLHNSPCMSGVQRRQKFIEEKTRYRNEVEGLLSRRTSATTVFSLTEMMAPAPPPVDMGDYAANPFAPQSQSSRNDGGVSIEDILHVGDGSVRTIVSKFTHFFPLAVDRRPFRGMQAAYDAVVSVLGKHLRKHRPRERSLLELIWAEDEDTEPEDNGEASSSPDAPTPPAFFESEPSAADALPIPMPPSNPYIAPDIYSINRNTIQRLPCGLPTVEDIIRRFTKGREQGGHLWYKTVHDVVEVYVGGSTEEMRLFMSLLAVTSRQATIRQNTLYALLNFRALSQGMRPFAGTYSFTSLLNYLCACLGVVSGYKLTAFMDNLIHPTRSEHVTIDTHMLRYMLGKGGLSLKPIEYAVVEDFFRTLTMELNIDLQPHALQSAIWTTLAGTVNYPEELKTLEREVVFPIFPNQGVIDSLKQDFDDNPDLSELRVFGSGEFSQIISALKGFGNRRKLQSLFAKEIRRKLLDLGYLSRASICEDEDCWSVSVSVVVPIRSETRTSVSSRLRMREQYAKRQNRALFPSEVSERHRAARIHGDGVFGSSSSEEAPPEGPTPPTDTGNVPTPPSDTGNIQQTAGGNELESSDPIVPIVPVEVAVPVSIPSDVGQGTGVESTSGNATEGRGSEGASGRDNKIDPISDKEEDLLWFDRDMELVMRWILQLNPLESPRIRTESFQTYWDPHYHHTDRVFDTTDDTVKSIVMRDPGKLYLRLAVDLGLQVNAP